jgi:hypothetical protein
MQEYQVQLTTSYRVFSVYKRYSQFYALNLRIDPRVRLCLPTFPPKALFQSASIVERRRTLLECWLLALLKEKDQRHLALEFIGTPASVTRFLSLLLAYPQLSTGDKLAAGLVCVLNSEDRLKSSALDSFSRRFFNTRHSVHDYFVAELTTTLVSLVGDCSLGGKVLNILQKLTTSQYCCQARAFKLQLCKENSEAIRLMHLELHLMRLIHGDSKDAALHILRILQTDSTELGPKDMLNNDEDAYKEFRNWTLHSYSPKKPVQGIAFAWNSLADTEQDISLTYRFIERTLEVKVSEVIESSLAYIVQAITLPIYRLQWDLTLKSFDVFKVQGNTGELRYEFIADRGSPVLTCIYKTAYSDQGATVSFTSSDDCSLARPCLKTLFDIERVERRRSKSFDDAVESVCQYRVNCCLKLCPQVAKAMLPYVSEENPCLVKTWRRFKQLTEGSQLEAAEESPSLVQVIERKRLGKKPSAMRRIQSSPYFM